MPSLELLPGWIIPARDLEYRAVRSSGPGGQNVNKVATKVELRFQLERSECLSAAQRERLRERFPSQVTSDGELVLSSDRTRSQEQNRDDVSERLRTMILSIRHPPKRRIRTRPSRAQKNKRLREKRKRADLKKQRGSLD